MKLSWIIASSFLLLPSTALAGDVWAGFGNGRSYTRDIVIVDASVSTAVTIIEALSWSPFVHDGGDPSGWIGLAPMLTLAGPITHFAHGRVIAGILSLLGWAGVDAIASLLPLTARLGESGGGINCRLPCPVPDRRDVVRANMIPSMAGATVMLLLDAVMARSVHAP